MNPHPFAWAGAWSGVPGQSDKLCGVCGASTRAPQHDAELEPERLPGELLAGAGALSNPERVYRDALCALEQSRERAFALAGEIVADALPHAAGFSVDREPLEKLRAVLDEYERASDRYARAFIARMRARRAVRR